MKYSGSDFKMTSQANHLAKLLNLKAENHRENIHAQRLYKRRRPTLTKGVVSNWGMLGDTALNGNAQNDPASPGSTTLQFITVHYDDSDSSAVEWEPIYGDKE